MCYKLRGAFGATCWGYLLKIGPLMGSQVWPMAARRQESVGKLHCPLKNQKVAGHKYRIMPLLPDASVFWY